jgi:hypothetical protein
VLALHSSVHFCRRIRLIIHDVSFVTCELDLCQTQRHRREGWKRVEKQTCLFFPRSTLYPRTSNTNLHILRFDQAVLYNSWPYDVLQFAVRRTSTRLTLHSLQLIPHWSCTGHSDIPVTSFSARRNKFGDNSLNFWIMKFIWVIVWSFVIVKSQKTRYIHIWRH